MNFLVFINLKEKKQKRKENKITGAQIINIWSYLVAFSVSANQRKVNTPLSLCFFRHRDQDAASESANGDLQFFVVGYILVIIYLAVMLGSFSRLNHKVGLVFFIWFDNIKKQPLEVFCENSCSQELRKIHRKTPVPGSLF